MTLQNLTMTPLEVSSEGHADLLYHPAVGSPVMGEIAGVSITIGTWNSRTLQAAGKLQELA